MTNIENYSSIKKLNSLNGTSEITNAIDSIENVEKYNNIVRIAKEFCYNIDDLKNENIPDKKEITNKNNILKQDLIEAIYNAYSQARDIKHINNTQDIKKFLKDLNKILKAVGVSNTDRVNITEVISYEKRYNKEQSSGVSKKFSDESFLDQSE